MTQASDFGVEASVLIDDSDPNIRYNGTWTVVPYADNGLHIRAPILSTLHVLPIFNGTLSYDFIGTGISLFTTTIGSSRNYTAECLIDGTPVKTAREPSNYGQNKPICAAFGLPDGILHTVSLSISVPPLDPDQVDTVLSGFCFDYILIQPSPTISLEGYNLFIDFMIPSGSESPLHDSFSIGDNAGQAASGGPGWILRSGNGFQTSSRGSQLNLSFTGIGILWYGYYTTEMPTGPPPSSSPLATFEIDGAPLQSFTPGPLALGWIDGTPLGFNLDDAGPIPSFNQTGLQNSSHTLTVVYHGTNKTTPLTLSSLVIQRSLNITSTTVVGATTSPSSQPMESHTGLAAGPVAGCIAGGLTFLLASIFSCFLYIRWKRRRAGSKANTIENMDERPEPFTTTIDSGTAIITPRKMRASQQHIEGPLVQELENPPITKWGRNVQQGNALEAPVAQTSRSTGISHHSPPTRPGSVGLDRSSISEEDAAREEDSGLRLGSQRDDRTNVPTLPPSYTMD